MTCVLFLLTISPLNFRHRLMLLWFADLMKVTKKVTIHRPLGLWIVTSSVTFIKSANQSNIKLCLIVHLVAVWTLIYPLNFLIENGGKIHVLLSFVIQLTNNTLLLFLISLICLFYLLRDPVLVLTLHMWKKR